MESEMRFWPRRLTILGHNSISHKEPFWHVLFLLSNCDTRRGNNKLPGYYTTTKISTCWVICAELKTWAAAFTALPLGLESNLFTLFSNDLLNT